MAIGSGGCQGFVAPPRAPASSSRSVSGRGSPGRKREVSLASQSATTTAAVSRTWAASDGGWSTRSGSRPRMPVRSVIPSMISPLDIPPILGPLAGPPAPSEGLELKGVGRRAVVHTDGRCQRVGRVRAASKMPQSATWRGTYWPRWQCGGEWGATLDVRRAREPVVCHVRQQVLVAKRVGRLEREARCGLPMSCRPAVQVSSNRPSDPHQGDPR